MTSSGTKRASRKELSAVEATKLHLESHSGPEFKLLVVYGITSSGMTGAQATYDPWRPLLLIKFSCL